MKWTADAFQLKPKSGALEESVSELKFNRKLLIAILNFCNEPCYLAKGQNFIKTFPAMKSVLVIFNGIKFPFYLMKYVLAQAKEHSASLHALFLKAKAETSAGYGFPSDLAQTENLTDSEDASTIDEKIIRRHMKLSTEMAGTENVSYTTELVTECSLSDILTIIEKFDLVCLDAAYDNETPSLLTSNSFTSKELIEKASSTLRLISEKEMDDA